MLTRALEFPWIVAYYVTSWVLARFAVKAFEKAWALWKALPGYLAPDGYTDRVYFGKSLECYAFLALGVVCLLATGVLIWGLFSLSSWLIALAVWVFGNTLFNTMLETRARNRSVHVAR